MGLVQDQETRVFPRVPDMDSLTLLPCKKLGFTRIFGLNTRRRGDEVLVSSNYRYGLSLARVRDEQRQEVDSGDMEDDESDVHMESLGSFPCCEGLVQTSFLSGDRMAYLAGDGVLNLWDMDVGQVELRTKLDHLVDEGRMKWSWGTLGQGLHPRSMLVGDR